MTEFMLSTNKAVMRTPHCFGKLGIEGLYCLIEGNPLIVEGMIYDDIGIKTKEDVYKKILHGHVDGVYNVLFYDVEEEKLYIRNDELAVLPIYICKNGNEIYVSNNVWKIIKNINILNIDKKILFMHFEIFNIVDKNRTFFSDISTLTAGSLCIIDINNFSITEKEYARDEALPLSIKMSFQEMAMMMYANLIRNFNIYNRKIGSKYVFFGNSGGLDSRLVPYYAQWAGINICGITIGEEYEKENIQTSTFHNAGMISSMYGFRNYKIPYDTGDWWSRFLLDIRNAPFIVSDMFKNPYTAFPKGFRFVICGQPALAVGTVAFTPQTDCISLDSFCRFFCNIFARKDLERLYPHRSDSIAPKHLYKWLEKYEYTDVLTLLKRVTRMIVSKHVTSCGGFESCSRLFFSIPHYSSYPYKLTNTYGNKTIFTERHILKTLINLKFKKLASLPDQKNEFINKAKDTAELSNILKLRGTGLHYYRWGRDEKWMRFAKNIFSYKSDIFESLFPDLSFSKLIHTLEPYNISKFLKVKFLFHIIEHGKYSIIENKEFNIVNHFETCGLELIDTYITEQKSFNKEVEP